MELVSWTIWYTWLAYFGLIGGLVAAAFLRTSPLRSAALGLAAGVVLATGVNIVASPAPCLESSKGLDILRAYRMNCIHAPSTIPSR